MRLTEEVDKIVSFYADSDRSSTFVAYNDAIVLAREVRKLRAECERMRLVFDLAKIWRVTEAQDLCYEPFARDHLDSIQALKNAIDAAIKTESK